MIMAAKARGLILSAATALAPTTTLADFNAEDYAPYEICALCHGLFGTSRMSKFPNLAGQDATYMQNQLEAYLDGTRTNASGQMKTIVTEITREDFEIVVDWFVTQDPPSPIDDGNDPAPGRAIYSDANCGSCHDIADMIPGVPHLTAQHPAYLTQQMLDFQAGDRLPVRSDIPHIDLLANLSKDDIQAIATFLAAKPREPHF